MSHRRDVEVKNNILDTFTGAMWFKHLRTPHTHPHTHTHVYTGVFVLPAGKPNNLHRCSVYTSTEPAV